LRALRPSLPPTILAVGAPLALAMLEMFHPHPGDLLALDVRTWLVVHYAQILLFPLTAVALALLVRGRRDIGAAICRIAMFVFAASYVAFDTAAGVVTGILVDAAQKSGAPNAWRSAIDAVWSHSIVGGSPQGRPPFLAVFGSIALSTGAIAAAVSLKRAGRSWPPILLLAISSFGIAAFKTHAWPGGPATFGGIAVAAAWLEWEASHAGVTAARPGSSDEVTS